MSSPTFALALTLLLPGCAGSTAAAVAGPSGAGGSAISGGDAGIGCGAGTGGGVGAGTGGCAPLFESTSSCPPDFTDHGPCTIGATCGSCPSSCGIQPMCSGWACVNFGGHGRWSFEGTGGSGIPSGPGPSGDMCAASFPGVTCDGGHCPSTGTYVHDPETHRCGPFQGVAMGDLRFAVFSSVSDCALACGDAGDAGATGVINAAEPDGAP